MIDFFLICPYSHYNPNIREKRFKHANRITAILINYGYTVYSPISHSHPIAIQENLLLDSTFWKKQNDTMIKLSNKIMVLDINGWKESTGCQNEIELAKSLNKDILFWSNWLL
jgi:hypothetical protein